MRKAILIVALTAGAALVGLADAWVRGRSLPVAAAVFGAIGLVVALVVIGLGSKRR